jgi:hypothetical protein
VIDAGAAFDDLVIALAFGRISREYFLAEASPLVELYAATLRAELREIEAWIPTEAQAEEYLAWFAREGEKKRRALVREIAALRAGGAPSEPTQPTAALKLL